MNARSFEVTYRELWGPVWAYCFRRVGTPAVAEDLTQDVFLRVWAARDRYEDRGFPLSTWVYRIAHNVAASYLRQRSAHRECSYDLGPDDLPVPAAFEREGDIDTRLSVEQALQLLPADGRRLLLTQAAGYSPAETGSMLGISSCAVRTRIHRARARLNRILSEPGSVSSAGAPRGVIRSGPRHHNSRRLAA